MTRIDRNVFPILGIAVLLAAAGIGQAEAIESPASSGEAATVDTPILRIPLCLKKPVIDGKFEEGEWEDASALSAFWYDRTQADFRFLAAPQPQLQLYACYDKENLYFAYVSPVYPKGSWLRARGRFPDVAHHPLYGILWGDHVELELRPYHDNVQGFRLGLFKWIINPTGTIADQHWSQTSGEGHSWTSGATIRTTTTPEKWVLEMAVPLEKMVSGAYRGQDEQGNPLVRLPPSDGTVYRGWWTRAIGGNGTFFNASDAHIWNTTKTKLIFDSQAPSFQVNELGPIMEDTIDLRMTIKNHAARSQTVRLGFFVENSEGLIYSSYEDAKLKDGLLELRPGEVRKIRLQQPFPGITRDGNVLWFDVRAAGQPARSLFRTRLVQFHSMDGGRYQTGSFREIRLDSIAALRPPRKDFDFRVNFSPYRRQLSAVIDRAIDGASPKAQTAVEARLMVMTNDLDEHMVVEDHLPMRGDFACFLTDVSKLSLGQTYKVSVLLFDANKRIVGEADAPPFKYEIRLWTKNTLGLEDRVWEPFVPLVASAGSLETLKHRYALDASGLPAQIVIRPDPRELPLERRGGKSPMTDADLLAIGRGPQLRGPMRLEAVVGGKRVAAEVAQPARLVAPGQSRCEYASKLKVGPVDVDLQTRYECDGSIYATMTYGSRGPAAIDLLEMVTELDGPVDVGFWTVPGRDGMISSDPWEITLPNNPGVVWTTTTHDKMPLFSNYFVPWFYFGSADRAFSYYCDTDRGWLLDRDGTTMTLERDAQRRVAWRVKFVNHRADVQGRRTISFAILVHPAKPKPADYRRVAWFYRGDTWCSGYASEPADLPEDLLRSRWREAATAPRDVSDEQATTWRKSTAPWLRYGRWRNVGISPELDQEFEDKCVYLLERQIRVGRRTGWWWDEYWPVTGSDNLAQGNAYLRDPAIVGPKELPWHAQFLTGYEHSTFKRLARIFAANNVPQRNYLWANAAASLLESTAWDCQLVEEAGAMHRSYELDNVVCYPASQFRFLAHTNTGMVCRIVPDMNKWATPGDDDRLDRQVFGRALLHDIGVCSNGPHGAIQRPDEALRLLKALLEFDLFDDQDTELLPYWRNRQFVRLGGDVVPHPLGTGPSAKVYVTAYRRPLKTDDGRGGVQALLVLMNENDKAVELPLAILDPQRVLGGPNNLTQGQIRARTPVPETLKDLWSKLSERDKNAPALRDVETGEVVARMPDASETYGPVYVPAHDYRILYAHCAKE